MLKSLNGEVKSEDFESGMPVENKQLVETLGTGKAFLFCSQQGNISTSIWTMQKSET